MNALQLFGFNFGAMASRCEVRLYAPDEGTGRLWADHAIAEVRRIEAKYSRYQPDSVVTTINTSAGRVVAVDDETADLIDFGARLHAMSDGRFDITSGVLRRAWNFKQAELPRAESLAALLPLIGWQKAEWSRPNLRLPIDGMEIDFGGIGKEYAADRAAAALGAAGALHGLVNLGGDVRAFGPPPEGMLWMIGIQHPRDSEKVLASLPVSKGAVATSGDYERYMEVAGKRYCHVLDPRTGMPANAWQSVSVAAPLCAAAGAAATLTMLMSKREGLAFLRAEELRFLAVDATGKIHRDQA